MNRREFIARALGSGVALTAGGIALLEEKLWQPTKTIVLPPKSGWVAGVYGYAVYDRDAGHGALPFGRGREFATMAAALRAATDRVGPALPQKYMDDDGEEYVWTPPHDEFVIWTQPAGTVAPYGRRVVYNSTQ